MNKQEMLQKVISHFSPNPNELRSVNKNGVCLYSPPTEKPLSSGCAIGIFLDKDLAQRLDKADKKLVCDIYRELPIDLQMGSRFLSSLQSLHDFDSNWAIVGLSRLGKEKVKRICSTNNLDFETIVW